MSGHDIIERNLARVFAALPTAAEQGIPRVEVHRRVGMFALVTVGHYLRALVRRGEATFDGPDCKRLYRRAA